MPDVILPVLDEREALPWVLERLPASYEPIVVDNGSTDGSGALARRLGAKVVREEIRGFGAACHAGLVTAGADLVCFMDCDGSLDPCELPSVAAPVAHGAADLVLGAAPTAPGRCTRELRTVRSPRNCDAAPAPSSPTWDRCGRPGGRRCSRSTVRDRRFGWPLEMVLRAAAAGWTVREVAVRYRPRTGRSKVTGTVRGTARAVRDMVAVLR